MVEHLSMKSTVLLIDDDPVDIRAMQALPDAWGLEVITARSGKEGLARMESTPFDLLIADVRMPGMSGEDVAAAVSKIAPGLPVILVTAFGDVRAAVKAMKLGAFDYVVKPPDEDEFRMTIERALEYSRLRKENEFLRAQMGAGGMVGKRLLGRSPKMLAMCEIIDRVALTDSTVLITGETGTGKELVAQTIHYKSRRASRPLVAVNCAALNANLIESELFGHEKGAFTGASASRRGRFEDADGGTLFLDEIGETSSEFQAKLLRAIQEGEIQRLGGNKTIKVDVRLLVSTNKDLEREVADGRFREDLFYRLSVIPVLIPPLRERREDIPILAAHFVARYAQRYGSEARQISPAAMKLLESLEWKGNVRELQHAIERAVVLCASDTLEVADFRALESAEPEEKAGDLLRDVIEERTREHVLAVLDRTKWHKQRAAEILGVDRATLYRLLRKYGGEK